MDKLEHHGSKKNTRRIRLIVQTILKKTSLKIAEKHGFVLS